MKLTLIQPTDVPEALRPQFGAYHLMVERMFANAGFVFETIRLSEGEPLPDPASLDATLIMGSSAGVYDNHLPWMEPLRAFIRGAYAARTPMLGICFGHQIMADALGGDVRKSEKGWASAAMSMRLPRDRRPSAATCRSSRSPARTRTR